MISEELFSRDGVSANSAQLTQLKALFPNCFDVSGQFLLEKFQSEIAEQADISREFYEMNWLGKSYAKLLRNLPPETLLCEDKNHNAKPENANSQNLLIQGDNLDVLKHLKNAYTNKVKMIYIDPPYNTGSDGFVYQDDCKFTPEQLSEFAHISFDEAERILKFTAKGSNSHSAWLTFMYPRLYIARELLKEDGVIFISIDDNEVAQLKLLCDEVFGEGNFVAEFIWDKKNSAKGVPPRNMVVNIHEYILCYSKNTDAKLIGELRTKDGFANPDNDLRGEWRLSNIKSTLERPQDKFSIIDPDTGRIFENYWAFSKNSLENMIEERRIIFPKNDDGLPKQKEFFNEFANPYMPIKSHLGWFDPQSKTEKNVEKLMGQKVFLYRKPLELMKKLILQSAENNEIILDFFAGSASTAHAVMQLNAEDNSNRQFILVQLPEKTDKKSEAFKAGYKTIFDITKARIKKAAAQIQAQKPNASGAKNIDSGFKIYQTMDNFRRHSDDEFSPEQVNLPFVENLTDTQMDTLTVFTKIPKNSIKIPVAGGGTYSPDFAYIVKTKTGEILNFVIEAKGVDGSDNLRKGEERKIKHAERLFAQISKEVKVVFKTQFEGDRVAGLIMKTITSLSG
ncbi:site-specific DNA-methyltransferase [Aggregatibacter actinomycetemcomitans]|uniref:site-specific DNA-methyltransferase n=4 Tax=Aggregatibacter actinomycetemcomitans TaxID=714 RepID=UPI0011D9EF5C|nr:site-specific DNA-methyltransferase [Aggregatibacter actinomycetemcomitans]TYA13929.1 site-specific DNA-methyltransferase [Aggregatibacter actinomycetemcomitans]TYA99639.1 site-specific DNA-methyltransferase [Aggregatibacter actinomycetemcomitans]TYB14092.1 site-specific DNA-methyltransferase [Aggregatibacter actinomycetemcomitans]TYB15508.1 site-specific DNA-methyltransferase [Aggregatibacter actinomycetemcomitans]